MAERRARRRGLTGLVWGLRLASPTRRARGGRRGRRPAGPTRPARPGADAGFCEDRLACEPAGHHADIPRSDAGATCRRTTLDREAAHARPRGTLPALTVGPGDRGQRGCPRGTGRARRAPGETSRREWTSGPGGTWGLGGPRGSGSPAAPDAVIGPLWPPATPWRISVAPGSARASGVARTGKRGGPRRSARTGSTGRDGPEPGGGRFQHGRVRQAQRGLVAGPVSARPSCAKPNAAWWPGPAQRDRGPARW